MPEPSEEPPFSGAREPKVSLHVPGSVSAYRKYPVVAARFGFAVAFKPEPAERPALVHDPRFYVPPYLGPSGWLALDLTVAPVDWTEVAELLEASYRQVALKRMLKDLATREHA